MAIDMSSSLTVFSCLVRFSPDVQWLVLKFVLTSVSGCEGRTDKSADTWTSCMNAAMHMDAWSL